MIKKLAGLLAAVAAVSGLAGCASVPDMNATPADVSSAVAHSTSHAPLITWYYEVAPKISRVERAVTVAQHAVRRPQHVGLAAACRTIKIRAQAVQAAPPAPDPVARHAFSREMTHFVNAADACMANELLAAGGHVNFAHYWSRVADNRILDLLRHKT